MILTICICTMPHRIVLLARLMRNLVGQIEKLNAQEQVEILVDDDMSITTGEKRNRLYNKAQGKYVCSVDDDDQVFSYYVEEILRAVESDPDAVAMNGIITWNGGTPQVWFISKMLPYQAVKDSRGHDVYLRFHNHLSPIRKSIAIQYPFPNKTMHEDFDFADRLHRSYAIRTEAVIGTTYEEFTKQKMHRVHVQKPMYHYQFRSQK
jgi:glycosyltransferase involved in cell wall biosynthesis